MAKKRRLTKKNGKAEPEAESTLLMPSTDDVVKLAKRRRQAKKQTSEISGTIGEAIAQACEKKHLDRTAFSIACRLDGMSPEKLAITFPHLMRYIKDMNLKERASEQSDFIQETEETEEEAEPAPDTNITRIGRGAAARRVSEAAGEASQAG